MSRGKKLFIGFIALAGLSLVTSIVHHYQLKASVERYRAGLKAKGIPTELSEALPEPVAPEQNGASNFLETIALLSTNRTALQTNPPLAMKMVAPGKAIIGATRSEIIDGKATNSWEEELAAIAENKAALDKLNQIPLSTKFDFHLPYEKGFYDTQFFSSTHLSEWKKVAQILTWSSLVSLHNQETAAAATNLNTAILLANAVQDQRTAISELVRIAMVSIAQTATWELLQSDRATDANLTALQKRWEQLEFIQSYKNSMVMEMVCELRMTEKLRARGNEWQRIRDLEKAAYKVIGEGDDEDETIYQKLNYHIQENLWRYWWSYPDELRFLQGMECMIGTANNATSNGLFSMALQRQDARLDQLGINGLTNDFLAFASDKTDFHSIMSQSVQSLSRCFQKTTQAETMRRLTVTAIALRRFEQKERHKAQELSQLVPEFLDSVPNDPMDAKPLRYRLNTDGAFSLYSVGLDAIDDGGNPEPTDKTITSLDWRKGRDWVWPQPATEEEIRFWKAKKPMK